MVWEKGLSKSDKQHTVWLCSVHVYMGMTEGTATDLLRRNGIMGEETGISGSKEKNSSLSRKIPITTRKQSAQMLPGITGEGVAERESDHLDHLEECD